MLRLTVILNISFAMDTCKIQSLFGTYRVNQQFAICVTKIFLFLYYIIFLNIIKINSSITIEGTIFLLLKI